MVVFLLHLLLLLTDHRGRIISKAEATTTLEGNNSSKSPSPLPTGHKRTSNNTHRRGNGIWGHPNVNITTRETDRVTMDISNSSKTILCHNSTPTRGIRINSISRHPDPARTNMGHHSKVLTFGRTIIKRLHLVNRQIPRQRAPMLV
jgi:hypothetical protein